MTMLEAITDVWTAMISTITGMISSAQTMFYAEGALTFLGTLSVIGVAVGVVFLIIGVIQNFLHLRG